MPNSNDENQQGDQILTVLRQILTSKPGEEFSYKFAAVLRERDIHLTPQEIQIMFGLLIEQIEDKQKPKKYSSIIKKRWEPKPTITGAVSQQAEHQ